MRLTCSQAAKLERLNEGESLPRSELSAAILGILQKAGVVQLEQSGSSYVVRGVPRKLAVFVEQHWGVKDLTRYAGATPGKRSRGLLVGIAGDSKALPSRPFDGIFIRSFGNCFLSDKPLNFTPQGTAILVTLGELPNLRVAAPYLVAVENSECLWLFEKAAKFFPELNDLNYAVVLRWHWGKAWRDWLAAWRGQLFYFPDYDPAGLRIFATEVLPHEPTARLLVPKDFEGLLEEHGKRGLYVKQERILNSLDAVANEQLALLCSALRRSRKAFEHESLIS